MVVVEAYPCATYGFHFAIGSPVSAYMLQHLEFLGANEFDDKPFIVMPYMTNGNARDYVRSYPDCNPLQIVCSSFFISLWPVSDGHI
jgi:hypothetical protein